jgi:ferritin-like metal-binding protein YciE
MNFAPSVQSVFFDQLRDLHGMEVLLLKATPRLAALSHHPALRSLILGWREDIDVQRIEISEIFARSQLSPGPDPGMTIMGIIEWGEADLEAVRNFPIRDLMMVAHCLRISHYAIAACEITGQLAKQTKSMREARILALMHERESQVADDLRELEPEIFRIAVESTYETAAQ